MNDNTQAVNKRVARMLMHGKASALIYPMVIADKRVAETTSKNGSMSLTRVNGSPELIVVMPPGINECTDDEFVQLLAHYSMHVAMAHPYRVARRTIEGLDPARLGLAADLLVEHQTNKLCSTSHPALQELRSIYQRLQPDDSDTLDTMYDKVPQEDADNYSGGEEFSGNGLSSEPAGDEFSEAEQMAFYQEVAQPVTDYIEKQHGLLTGGEWESIKPKQAKFPASAQIKAWVARKVEVGVSHSRKRVSKRYGTPENPCYGANRFWRPVSHILLGVDVSGSMLSEELALIFGALRHAQVSYDIVQFDTQITDILEKAKVKTGEVKVFGRGGTSFGDLHKYANEHYKKYAGVVVFTDGDGDAPSQPPIIPWLWVITKLSGGAPVNWGQVINTNLVE